MAAIDTAPPPVDLHEETVDRYVRLFGDGADLARAFSGAIVHPAMLKRLRAVAPDAMAMLDAGETRHPEPFRVVPDAMLHDFSNR